MRYIKPLKKVILTGSKAMLSTALLKQNQHPKKIKHTNQEYPIIFMHGFMGFSERSVFNLTLFDYFNGAQNILKQMGYQIYAPSINALASVQERNNQWIKAIDDILLETGCEKVHIIAHSQGAIDARIIATPIVHHCRTPYHGELYGSGYGDHIASITSVAGPHMGTPLADPVYADDEDGELMSDVINLIAMMTGKSHKSARQAMDFLSRKFMLDVFNPSMKVPNNIPCFTITGNPANKKDLSSLFDLTWQKLMDTAIEDGGGENDGFAPVSSARFDSCKTLLAGTDKLQWMHLGHVKADHMALIGIPAESSTHTNFSHQPLYVGIAQHTDSNFIQHMQLALQDNGHWQRQKITQPA
ncbi:MAG: hypothetical protein HRU20_11640 [Pseudomonadales bacterium]|nr:hypothetical protein [Pseudomonadales bacterium]